MKILKTEKNLKLIVLKNVDHSRQQQHIYILHTSPFCRTSYRSITIEASDYTFQGLHLKPFSLLNEVFTRFSFKVSDYTFQDLHMELISTIVWIKASNYTFQSLQLTTLLPYQLVFITASDYK